MVHRGQNNSPFIAAHRSRNSTHEIREWDPNPQMMMGTEFVDMWDSAKYDFVSSITSWHGYPIEHGLSPKWPWFDWFARSTENEMCWIDQFLVPRFASFYVNFYFEKTWSRISKNMRDGHTHTLKSPNCQQKTGKRVPFILGLCLTMG